MKPTNSSLKENSNVISERESEVLNLIAKGKTNRQIGESLFISSETVKMHLRNIFRKTGVHNRIEALEKAKVIQILSHMKSHPR